MNPPKYDPEMHHRRSIRLQGYDYSQAGAYYITICTQKRACLFGQIVDGEMVLNEYGEIVKTEWLKTSKIRRNITLDEFVIMPNHLHGIIIITEKNEMANIVGAIHRIAPTNEIQQPPRLQSGSMGAIIGQYKSIITKRINQIRDTPGFSVWQRNYYEHIIRNENELNRIRKYILNNPANWLNDKNRADY